MFVVEADHKRLLHTGDFRGHGFRSKGLIPTLQSYAQDIDYLISEGSNIQRPHAAIQTEQALQKAFITQFSAHKYSFVFVSSTNIDRLFSLYHAAKEAKRCFVCDFYQSEILKLVSENHKQHTDFYGIDYDRIKPPAGRFFILKPKGRNAFSFEGKFKAYLETHGFCMLVRENDAFKALITYYAESQDSKLYFSMWKGYLNRTTPAFNKSLSDFLKPYAVAQMHTSGHADLDTLKRVFETVKPKGGIIPIHTDRPEKFKKVFQLQYTIILLQDGEAFEVK